MEHTSSIDRGHIIETHDRLRRIADARGIGDVVGGLEDAARRLQETTFRLAVLGEYKREVRFRPEPGATVEFLDGRSLEITPDELSAYVTEPQNPRTRRRGRGSAVRCAQRAQHHPCTRASGRSSERSLGTTRSALDGLCTGSRCECRPRRTESAPRTEPGEVLRLYRRASVPTTKVGAMFWFIRNRFVGSNFSFSAASRPSFAPYAALSPSAPSSPPR
jgi:hypothetical protein